MQVKETRAKLAAWEAGWGTLGGQGVCARPGSGPQGAPAEAQHRHLRVCVFCRSVPSSNGYTHLQKF